MEIKKDKEIIDALKILEPRLKDIKIRITGVDATILVDIGKERLMPLPLAGLGMMKILRLIIYMLKASHGCVLIDEIEVGLHWKALLPIWQLIEKIAEQYNVQVFATTHSLECIHAAVEAFSNKEKFKLGIFRLEETKQGIKSVAYDENTIKAVLDNDLEVR
ncbi:ATPase-like protein [Candidatus Omnitrophus magneticus]|uniref:ATPase-like protein n=1 Tax=Candidatus Omnitrophus magneticus TaxID=1609969 RepID=A0A0F0CUW5_9BACT|nr:ATPase-like protein [Candidatus Omnitrophus magneticus]